ncbi:RsfS/YbeB/iojap family protein [Candidatus Margulisiibacteriota bacterium]
MSSIEKILEKVVSESDSNKAFNIRAYLAKDKSLTDYYVLMSVNNYIHSKTILKELSKLIKKFIADEESMDFYQALRVSGSPGSGWVVIDLNSIIVHILDSQVREFYELDSLFEQKGIVYHY